MEAGHAIIEVIAFSSGQKLLTNSKAVIMCF